MIPSVSLTSLGIGAGGLLVGSASPSLMDGMALLCVASVFVFICSIEAAFAS